MEPNFWVIGLLLEYRSVIKFLAAIDILSGVMAFLLDLLRLSKVTARALPLPYAGIWTGMAWIVTGLFAILASMHATRYHRLKGYVLGLLLFGLLSLSVCVVLIVNISYFPKTFSNYYVTDRHEFQMAMEDLPFLAETGPGVKGMVWNKAAMVTLAVVNLYTAVCEVVFGVAQFRSGYFDFVEQWSQPIPDHKLRRSRTVPVVAKSARSPTATLEIGTSTTRPEMKRAISMQEKSHAQARKVQSVPF